MRYCLFFLLFFALAACTPSQSDAGVSSTGTESVSPTSITTIALPATVAATTAPATVENVPQATATAEETIPGFPENAFFKEQFPKAPNPDGSYSFTCIVEDLVVLPEGQFAQLDHGYEVIGYLACAYYDKGGNVQRVNIPLNMQNVSQSLSVVFGSPPVSGNIPYSVVEESYQPGEFDYNRFFGKLVNVSFGDWQSGYDYLSQGYGRELMEEIGFEEFAETGNPDDLGSDWLVPLNVQHLN